MKPRKDTHKAGIRAKPRGQQMGTARREQAKLAVRKFSKLI